MALALFECQVMFLLKKPRFLIFGSFLTLWASVSYPPTILSQVGRTSSGPATPRTSAENASSGSIRGRVVFPNGTLTDQSIRIRVQNLRGTQTIIFTDNQGQFEIRNLPAGEYTLEVDADNLRFEVISERVEVYRGSPSIVTITLKEKPAANRSRAATVVSVGELEGVPIKARKEFERASDASREGRVEEAIKHLKNAIAMFPEFMMAHNDLGAHFLEQGNLDAAATELHRAIELDDKAFNPQLNLGIVLLKQQKFSESIDILRKALSLRSDSTTTRFYLGLALLGGNHLEQAERELDAAYKSGGASYALALFHLGQLYLKRHDRKRALDAFEAYLRDMPNAANAADVQKLIKSLR